METVPDLYPSSSSIVDHLHSLQFDQLLFYIALALLSLLMLALFSASEKAYAQFDEVDIVELKKSEEKRDQQLLNLLDKPSSLAALFAIMNTLSLSLFIGVSFLLLHIAFANTLSLAIQVWVFLVLLALFAVKMATFLPALYARKYYKRFAYFSMPFLQAFAWLLRPLIQLLFFGFRIVNKLVPSSIQIAADEFNRLDDSELINEENEDEQMILKGIANFGNISVKQIMRNRMDVFALDFSEPYLEVDKKIKETRYSRLPVFEGNLDTIKGILFAKDLLINKDKPDFNWQNLIRPAYFVPENKKIDDLLKEFKTKHTHIAIVVDEYGGTSGIVTLEDILEEIVGDISDEYDEADDELRYSKLDDHNYVFDGKTPLNDIYRLLNLEEDTFDEVRGEADTIGGLVLAIAGRFVFNREKVKFENFIFTIESADRRRVKRVKLSILDHD